MLITSNILEVLYFQSNKSLENFIPVCKLCTFKITIMSQQLHCRSINSLVHCFTTFLINNIRRKWSLGAQWKQTQHIPCNPSPMMWDPPLGKHCLQFGHESSTRLNGSLSEPTQIRAKGHMAERSQPMHQIPRHLTPPNSNHTCYRNWLNTSAPRHWLESRCKQINEVPIACVSPLCWYILDIHSWYT